MSIESNRLLPIPIARQVQDRALQDRIAAAPAGALIKISPGEYQGPLILDKPVTLVGNGRSTVIWSGIGPTILVLSAGVRLVDLGLETTLSDAVPTVLHRQDTEPQLEQIYPAVVRSQRMNTQHLIDLGDLIPGRKIMLTFEVPLNQKINAIEFARPSQLLRHLAAPERNRHNNRRFRLQIDVPNEEGILLEQIVFSDQTAPDQPHYYLVKGFIRKPSRSMTRTALVAGKGDGNDRTIYFDGGFELGSEQLFFLSGGTMNQKTPARRGVIAPAAEDEKGLKALWLPSGDDSGITLEKESLASWTRRLLLPDQIIALDQLQLRVKEVKADAGRINFSSMLLDFGTVQNPASGVVQLTMTCRAGKLFAGRDKWTGKVRTLVNWLEQIDQEIDIAPGKSLTIPIRLDEAVFRKKENSEQSELSAVVVYSTSGESEMYFLGAHVIIDQPQYKLQFSSNLVAFTSSAAHPLYAGELMGQQTEITVSNVGRDALTCSFDATAAWLETTVSDEQAEEGRSGLPRQLTHIHEIACEKGLRVSWDFVFAEDYSGFVLEHPELSRLLKTLHSSQRQANVVVIEHLDRLSRNADWHQGYLMEQLEKQLNVRVVFWKPFASRIERAVMGAVAQEGMELAKARMAEGIVNKALSGRVTSRKRAYGFKFVDDRGQEGERARKFTHYAIFEDEAMIVRTIFRRVCSGDTLYKILCDFTDTKIKPPGNYKAWDTTFLRLLIQNPVYKGEYVANRVYMGEVQKPTKNGLSVRTVKKTLYRPEEEWIRVPVPAIVDTDTWQRANEMLQKSRQMATRNAKHDYLLNGLLRCAECGFVFSGTRLKENLKGGRYTDYYGYYCSTKSHYTRKKVYGVTCSQGYITCRVLDKAVWTVVCDLLLKPETLVTALESNLRGERNEQVNRQIEYLERELERKHAEDEKLYRAYMAEVFDELEYKDRRGQIRADMAQLSKELELLRPKQMTQQQFEAQKAELLAMSERLRNTGTLIDPPFELKRRILKMTVDAIHVNQREGWFTLTGSIQSRFQFESVSA